jgi:enamine deaminase RidA (YjgF/YER057c/UK114 family)
MRETTQKRAATSQTFEGDITLNTARFAIAWASLFALTAPLAAHAAPAHHMATPQKADPVHARPLVTTATLAFPSGVAGTRGDAMEQVDEIVAAMHQRLQSQGLGIGDMMQHTIYLKDGAASPIDILGRFHAAARKLAPSLVTQPSVGTIVRVPAFPDPRTLVAVDLTASARPQAPLTRVPFTFGPKEIVETIGTGDLVFTAGLETMDFEHGTLKPTIDEQIDVIMGKLDGAMKKVGLGVGNMVSHNLYVTKGTDPIHVIEAFHRAARRYAPELKEHPSVGTLVVVDGMAVPQFLLEIDAVASRNAPETLKRVPFTEMPMDIAKSIATDSFVYVAGMEGVDFAHGNTVATDVAEQAAVAARKVADALAGQGLKPSSAVKYKIYVKQGADVAQALAAFHRQLAQIDPLVASHAPAETVIIVEGLAGPTLQFEVSAIAARHP